MCLNAIWGLDFFMRYKIVKPKELRGLFLPYHTMDTAQAIDRILEAKKFPRDDAAEEQRQFEIFKRIRQSVNQAL